MLTKWTVANFKSIEEPTSLDLSPLTIFAGINSGGKSTLFQSILLVSQTFQNRDSSKVLALNGTFVRLGDITDIRTFGSVESRIRIGWEAEPGAETFFSTIKSQFNRMEYLRKQYKQICGEISIEPGSTKERNYQLNPNLVSLKLSCRSIHSDQETWLKLDKNTLFDQTYLATEEEGFENILSENQRFDIEMDEVSSLDLKADFKTVLIGASLKHFLPAYFIVKFSLNEALALGLVEALSKTVRHSTAAVLRVPSSVIELFQELGFSLPDPLSIRDLSLLLNTDTNNKILETLNKERVLAEIESILESEPSAISTTYLGLPTAVRECSELTENLFATDVRYLGPLRDQPKAIFPLTGTLDSTDVGLRGENAAAVFHQHRRDLIQAILPTNFKPDGSVDGEIDFYPLGKAVQEWMNYLGLTDKIITVDKGKHGHELKVRTPGTRRPHDLTHAGVGVSQVFPIVVMCLTAPRGSILLLEKPELHLHPKVQALLGDFFLSMAMLGKQCLVETHSEYLIDKLRWRTACSRDSTIKDLFDVYFVQKDRVTSFQKLQISRYGSICNWPEGFFDQSHNLTEQILLAATKKLEEEEEEESSDFNSNDCDQQ